MFGLMAGFMVAVAFLLVANDVAGGPYAIFVALAALVLAVVIAIFDPHGHP